MSILSLFSATAVMIGAGTWGADASLSRQSEFSGPDRSNSEIIENLARNPKSFDASDAHGDNSRRFGISDRKLEFCGSGLELQSGCLIAGELYENKKETDWRLGDRAPEISDADKLAQTVVPIPAAAPLLLSALAGLAFASRGRQSSRRGSWLTRRP